jgi:hypothetical protein
MIFPNQHIVYGRGSGVFWGPERVFLKSLLLLFAGVEETQLVEILDPSCTHTVLSYAPLSCLKA